MSKTSNEKIGYRNPPQSTQFKKGHSGNPNGRPKGKRNLATVLEKTLHEKVVINENGRRKTITKLEAAVKQLVNKAASGDLRALHHLTALARSADERSPEAITPTSVIAEVDQKVLQGIFSRFEHNGNGGGDNEPDDK
jgi:replication-associated recombination protein RarA